MRLLNYLGVILAVFFILALPSVSAYEYVVDYYDSGSLGATSTAKARPIDCNTYDCDITDKSRADTFGTGAYTITSTYYSPYSTIKGATPELGVSGNQYCIPIGEFTSDIDNGVGVAEAKQLLQGGFTSGRMVNRRTVTKDIGTDEWMEFSINNDSTILDTEGVFPEIWGYKATYSSPFPQPPLLFNLTVWQPKLNSSNYGDCGIGYPGLGDISSLELKVPIPGVTNYFTATLQEYYYPFNSSVSGALNVYLKAYFFGTSDVVSVANGELAVIYYEPQDPIGTKVTLCYQSGLLGYSECNNTITGLDENEEFMLVFIAHQKQYGSPSAVSSEASIKQINVSISAIAPEWQCGGWSECINQLQYRSCIDLTGKFPDTVEYKECLTAEELARRTINLGFEDDYPVTHIARCSIGAFCLPYVSNVTGRFFPTDWSVTSPLDPVGRELNYLDTLAITSEKSTERYKSLKMWDIPIGSFYVFPENVTGNLFCGNYTWWHALYYWDVDRRINATNWVEHNITLPAPYSLTFDVRRCDTPVTEFYSWYPCVYGEPTDIYHKWQTCYGSCNSTPRGEFAVHLGGYNLTDTWEVLDYRSSAVDEWRHYAFNLGNLVDNETEYSLSYYLDIEDHYNSYCIYIDNVNLVPTVVITEDQCFSYCDNETYGLYHRATWDNSVCILEDEYLSSICLSSEDYGDVVEGRGWYCDVTTKVYWDSPQLEWIRIENNADCIAEARERGLTDPYIDPDRMDDPEYVADQINDLILIFLSPAFLSILISLSIAVIIGAKLEGNWMLSLVSFFSLLTVFSLAGMFPLLLLILLIVVTGLILAKTMFGFFGGK